MKKVIFYTLLFALVTGCSGRTETATESTTSGIAPQKDAISQWLDQIRNDDNLSQKLSHVPLADNQALNQDIACDDADVKTALKNRHNHPVVITPDHDDTEAALDILLDIPNHGSAFVPPHLDQIKSLAQNHKSPAPPNPFVLSDSDVTTLEKSLRTAGFNPNSPDSTQALVQLLQSDECSHILPRYCEYMQNIRNTQSEYIQTSSQLDTLLACDLTLWAGELRLNYPQNDYKFDRFRKYMSDEAIVSTRKQVFVEDMAKSGVSIAFKRITPPDQQYALLKKSRAIYTDAIAAGGWPEVPSPAKIVDPKLGKSYDYVPAMRKRLKAEGYGITDTESDVFDQQFMDAITLYRDVHQLNDRKLIDNVLFKNLAVSPNDRLETIDLALQKYRESAIGSLNYYVKVNIPDFYVEVWKDHQRLLRNRIVVGNDKLEKDPETGHLVPDPETLYPLHPNRTPIQTSKINEIILNPYWNVPTRIRIQELEPKLAENPNYYEENNYEEVNVDNPKLYYVREKPNPKNSLGQVKFMFPNPHNTYLHDTPAKAAFKNPTRALSHGCMRVQNPLDMARLMLNIDGQYNEREFNAILHANPLEQVTIEMKHPVDVDVVYINARVDDSGVVAFLSDVYQYDAVRQGKVTLKKLPKSWVKQN